MPALVIHSCAGCIKTGSPGFTKRNLRWVAGNASLARMQSHPNDPLHGVTLETVLKTLVDRYGWQELADRIPIRCFMFDPTIKSSLTFLRKTPWARKRLEDWFVYDLRRSNP